VGQVSDWLITAGPRYLRENQNEQTAGFSFKKILNENLKNARFQAFERIRGERTAGFSY
jgi:hypothetical protein